MTKTKEVHVTVVEIADLEFYRRCGFSQKKAEELAALRRRDRELADLFADFGDSIDPDFKPAA